MFDIIQLLATVIGLGLVIYQLRRDSIWNRTTKAHETLNGMVSGDFVEILDELLIEFDWDIVAPGQGYSETKNRIETGSDASSVVRMTARMVHLLRILETITISVKKGLVDEQICREYLFSILINVHRNTKEFIANERVRRENPAIFEHVEEYAQSWARG
ncbi:MAG: DUF4760 domain-containing protein [Pseudomonadota bacterium]